MRTKVNPVRQLNLLISSKNKEWFRQHRKPKQNALKTEAAQTKAVHKTNYNSCIEADRGMEVSKGKLKKSFYSEEKQGTNKNI